MPIMWIFDIYIKYILSGLNIISPPSRKIQLINNLEKDYNHLRILLRLFTNIIFYNSKDKVSYIKDEEKKN